MDRATGPNPTPPPHQPTYLNATGKNLHCRELGITHFIDDRADVLEPMADIVPNRYLFGPQRGRIPAGMRHAMTWREVERAMS